MSDNEYSQDAEGNKITPEGVVPAENKPEEEAPADACPAGGACPLGGVCALTGGPCPISNPHILEQKIEEHLVCFQRVQEVLLLKRPVVLAIVFVLLNFVLILYRKLDLNFYALATLVLLLVTLYKSFVQPSMPKVIDALFSSNVEQGDANAPNRIRSPKEVAALISKYMTWLPTSVNMLVKMKNDETTTGRLIWCGVLFLAFLVFALCDFFWPIAIFLNVALLALPIYCLVLTYNKKEKAD